MVKWIWLVAALITMFLFNYMYYGVFGGNEIEAATRAQSMMVSIQSINILNPVSWILYIKDLLTWDYAIFVGVLSWIRFILIVLCAIPMAWIIIDIGRTLIGGLSSITSWFRW